MSAQESDPDLWQLSPRSSLVSTAHPTTVARVDQSHQLGSCLIGPNSSDGRVTSERVAGADREIVCNLSLPHQDLAFAPVGPILSQSNAPELNAETPAEAELGAGLPSKTLHDAALLSEDSEQFLFTRKAPEKEAAERAEVEDKSAPMRPPAQVLDSSSRESSWIGAEGDIVQIGGMTYRLSNVYVGTRDQAPDNLALIDTSLSIDAPPEDSGGNFCTWKHLYPEARLEFLAWISCGRKHSQISSGALHFYFHGLERRLLIDRACSEAASIKTELEALKEVFSGDLQFVRIVEKLIQVCHQLDPSLLPAQLPRAVPNLEMTVPHECRLHCAKMMARWGSLDASDALVWKTNQPGFRFDGHVVRHLEYFEECWYLGFPHYFPDNIVISPTGTPVRLTYQAVNGAFWEELVSDLADPCSVAPPPELDELYQVCIEGLEPLRHVDRRRRGGCLDIATPKFRNRASEPGAILATEPTRQKLEALLGDERLTVLTGAQLLGTICSGGYRKNGPVPRPVMQQLRSAFCSLGFGFEPDPEYSASLVLTPDTQLALFRAQEGGVVARGRIFELAHAAMTLSCLASSSYPGLEPVETEVLLKSLHKGDSLSDVEVQRLTALRAAMTGVPDAPLLLKSWCHAMVRLGRGQNFEELFELAFSGKRRNKFIDRFARQLCLALGYNRSDAEFFLRHVQKQWGGDRT